MACEGHRLPTEAEWEHAARAGTTSTLYHDDGPLIIEGYVEDSRNAPQLDAIAWYGGNAGVDYADAHDCAHWAETQDPLLERCGPHPVGQKMPNAWGLYDTIGNVYEWTWDCDSTDYGGFGDPAVAVESPTGPPTTPCHGRVLRSGPWNGLAQFMRTARRVGNGPPTTDDNIGLRPVRSLKMTICIDGTSIAPCNGCPPDIQVPDDWVCVPDGDFVMGSEPEIDPDHFANEPPHVVHLTRPFLMQATELTHAQWTEVMGEDHNPSYFQNCGPDCPVERVNWYEAVAFANAWSTQRGLEPCYTLIDCQPGGDGPACPPATAMECQAGYTCTAVESIPDCNGYRLPTEAEWERAVRAGTHTAIYTGDMVWNQVMCSADLDPIAWYDGSDGVDYDSDFTCPGAWTGCNGRPAPVRCGVHPVAQKMPNAWGLYDMLGNEWEWVWDRYADDYGGLPPFSVDPTGPAAGESSIWRGGSWGAWPNQTRSAYRLPRPPTERNAFCGFRLVRAATE